MNGDKKKFDIWPLVVGVIAAIGIIGSNSTGGITKQTSDRTTVQTTTAISVTTGTTVPSGASGVSPSATTMPFEENWPIRLISLTSPVKAGAEASIRLTAQPNTEYVIEIRYGSKVSTIAGLDPKTAGPDGLVGWDWHVGSLTTRGEYVILIKGGGETLEARLLVD